jgi:hypothetical protein
VIGSSFETPVREPSQSIPTIADCCSAGKCGGRRAGGDPAEPDQVRPAANSNSLKNWTDEELDAGIDLVKQMLESRAAASGAVIEGQGVEVLAAKPLRGSARLLQPPHLAALVEQLKTQK